MPMKAKSPCLEQGCPKLVERGRCPAHAKTNNTRVYTGRNTDEVSKWYRTARWARFRQWFLRAYPQCERIVEAVRCEQPATLVHHRVSPKDNPELFCSEENCVALCAPHHNGLRGSKESDVFAARES